MLYYALTVLVMSCVIVLFFLSCLQYDSDLDSEYGTLSQKRGRRRKKKKTTIYDVYEPSELERGHFLERDTEIRVTDIPERLVCDWCD